MLYSEMRSTALRGEKSQLDRHGIEMALRIRQSDRTKEPRISRWQLHKQRGIPCLKLHQVRLTAR